MSMRRLINLTEEATWLTLPPEVVHSYVDKWDHNPDRGDGDGGSTMDVESIAAAQKHFTALTAGPLTIYRAMTMSPWGIEPETGIGMCWTLDERYAVPYGGSGRSKTSTLTFRATIAPSSVDWLATIALVDGGEQEIRLKRGAPIKVEDIHDGYGEPVAKNVWGETFYARSGI